MIFWVLCNVFGEFEYINVGCIKYVVNCAPLTVSIHTLTHNHCFVQRTLLYMYIQYLINFLSLIQGSTLAERLNGSLLKKHKTTEIEYQGMLQKVEA